MELECEPRVDVKRGARLAHGVVHTHLTVPVVGIRVGSPHRHTLVLVNGVSKSNQVTESCLDQIFTSGQCTHRLAVELQPWPLHMPVWRRGLRGQISVHVRQTLHVNPPRRENLLGRQPAWRHGGNGVLGFGMLRSIQKISNRHVHHREVTILLVLFVPPVQRSIGSDGIRNRCVQGRQRQRLVGLGHLVHPVHGEQVSKTSGQLGPIHSSLIPAIGAQRRMIRINRSHSINTDVAGHIDKHATGVASFQVEQQMLVPPLAVHGLQRLEKIRPMQHIPVRKPDHTFSAMVYKIHEHLIILACVQDPTITSLGGQTLQHGQKI
mmetsp:Transcript_21536/g.52408  ORF Transcript_21536/g.52408 Transcript_21536/m.52408 type:complete len:322 (+) Transcript_21536:372-1337(+)